MPMETKVLMWEGIWGGIIEGEGWLKMKMNREGRGGIGSEVGGWKDKTEKLRGF